MLDKLRAIDLRYQEVQERLADFGGEVFLTQTV